jgi:hypothetical protein
VALTQEGKTSQNKAPMAEGFIKNTVVGGVNTFSYIYNYTDHLGNVKAEALQFINMDHAKKVEDGGGPKQGNLIGHEVNESFTAAKENGGVNRANSANGDAAYNKGHKEAIRVDPTTAEPGFQNVNVVKYVLSPLIPGIKIN